MSPPDSLRAGIRRIELEAAPPRRSSRTDPPRRVGYTGRFVRHPAITRLPATFVPRRAPDREGGRRSPYSSPSSSQSPLVATCPGRSGARRMSIPRATRARRPGFGYHRTGTSPGDPSVSAGPARDSAKTGEPWRVGPISNSLGQEMLTQQAPGAPSRNASPEPALVAEQRGPSTTFRDRRSRRGRQPPCRSSSARYAHARGIRCPKAAGWTQGWDEASTGLPRNEPAGGTRDVHRARRNGTLAGSAILGTPPARPDGELAR